MVLYLLSYPSEPLSDESNMLQEKFNGFRETRSWITTYFECNASFAVHFAARDFQITFQL